MVKSEVTVAVVVLLGMVAMTLAQPCIECKVSSHLQPIAQPPPRYERMWCRGALISLWEAADHVTG